MPQGLIPLQVLLRVPLVLQAPIMLRQGKRVVRCVLRVQKMPVPGVLHPVRVQPVQPAAIRQQGLLRVPIALRVLPTPIRGMATVLGVITVIQGRIQQPVLPVVPRVPRGNMQLLQPLQAVQSVP